jgi:hypothetical protein
MAVNKIMGGVRKPGESIVKKTGGCELSPPGRLIKINSDSKNQIVIYPGTFRSIYNIHPRSGLQLL